MTSASATAAAPPLAPPPFASHPTQQQLFPSIAEAIEQGRSDATAWLREHPQRDDEAFERYVHAKHPALPTAQAQEAELGQLRSIRDARTAGQSELALWHAHNGAGTYWQQELERYGRTTGADQARRAVELIDDARRLNLRLTLELKERHGRPRPYVTDPSLQPLMQERTKAFPSGHASSSAAQGAAMASLQPQRRADFVGMTQQMAYARMYAGVHYPSDVISGAWLGALVGTYVAGAAR